MGIEVLNESGVQVDERGLVDLARHVLAAMDVHPLAELSLLLVDEPAMIELHEKWMGEQGPTDVLAFPMDELRPGHKSSGSDEGASDPALLGDVVLCPAVAERQAKAAAGGDTAAGDTAAGEAAGGQGSGHSTADELEMLCTHGILHLLGYDHAEPEEHKEMFDLQALLLTSWQEKRAQQ